MKDNQVFAMGKLVRGLTVNSLKNVSDEHMLITLDGLNNNILWNAGHILYLHGVFLYTQTGNDIPLPDSYKGRFNIGTSPSDWDETPDPAEVLSQLASFCERIEKDRADNKFQNFDPFPLFGGLTIDTLHESVMFNCAHEGIHLGRIGTIKKLLKQQQSQ